MESIHAHSHCTPEKPNRGEMDDCLAESIIRHGACSPPLQSRCNPHTSKPVNWEKLRMSVNSVVITDCHLACNSIACLEVATDAVEIFQQPESYIALHGVKKRYLQSRKIP